LRDLDYQGHVLARLGDYLTELSSQKLKADKVVAANAGETDPDLIRPLPDFPLKTWETLRASGKLPESRLAVPYSARTGKCSTWCPATRFSCWRRPVSSMHAMSTVTCA